VTFSRAARLLVTATCIAAMTMTTGCAKRPGKDELSKLDEAKSAAESAEKKLAELKQERIRLDADLQQKQDELKKAEEERDNIKQKTGK
jgi:outer membrane murein-binding lipoprotein Lpp